MWKEGRLKTGYKVLTLWNACKFDIRILKFPKGSYAPKHKDPVLNFKHFRWSWTFGLYRGGDFQTCSDFYTPLDNPEVFRPDITLHRVLPVTQGTMYILSIGWIK